MDETLLTVYQAVLQTILSYFVGVAANLRTAEIQKSQAENLQRTVDQEIAKAQDARKVFASNRSLRDELRGACMQLARERSHLHMSPQEMQLWSLLSEDAFQDDVYEWLRAGGIAEGDEVKTRLLNKMEHALAGKGCNPSQILFLKNQYFDSLDRAIFDHPILAQWRHQLSLDYLREQVAALRTRAEEAAGVYSVEKQHAALDRYCKTTLDEWDIIDLSNLPEGDIHIATQTLLLRQLYMPLRITGEERESSDDHEDALARIEEDRDARRRREAGHMQVETDAEDDEHEFRGSVGERLKVSRRLVVLADPGGGKTTMLRWIATAYLLRRNKDRAFSLLPDTDTLPPKNWIPVLIRCRDLGPADLCRSFSDFLSNHLNKSELLPEEAKIMQAVILDRIARGEALLLVDGLDEISDPRVRVLFCQELERTAARYAEAPVIVTSRIVGYRDMPYRMGPTFEHGIIAELDRKDKDLFATRWVEVTEQQRSITEKKRRVQELVDALHSSDRIERLTGNPMLLTTLALVKRKVGKLPNKRTKLYDEAVSVLLNWNPTLYETIEEDEAIPQLEYLAYQMCSRGVQRLMQDEVLDLLERVRTEYPNVRATRRRTPEQFLAHLEARSSILIRSGGIWQTNRTHEQAVWEFRHLTFQEYLAARALVDGRYPGRDKSRSLAEQVAPLAVSTAGTKQNMEAEIPESWQEALRLLVADCKDDDVDSVLRSILTPLPSENGDETGRPRAILAGLCLADEPNVGEDTALSVIRRFVDSIDQRDGKGRVTSMLDKAAMELCGTAWALSLKEALLDTYFGSTTTTQLKTDTGGLLGMVELRTRERNEVTDETYFAELLMHLRGQNPREAAAASLAIMNAAYEGDGALIKKGADELVAVLLTLLERSESPVVTSVSWALGWLSAESGLHDVAQGRPYWNPKKEEVPCILAALRRVGSVEAFACRWLVVVGGRSRDPRLVPSLIDYLGHSDPNVRRSCIDALAKCGVSDAVRPLMACLHDTDASVRSSAARALGGSNAEGVLEELVNMIGDSAQTVESTLESVILGADRARAAALVASRVGDGNVATRKAALALLGKLGSDLMTPALVGALKDPVPEVRKAAIDALKLLNAKESIGSLMDMLSDSSEVVRRAAVSAIGHLGDEKVLERLLDLADDENARVRFEVATATRSLRSDRAIRQVLRWLDDRDARVRRSAISALGDLGQTDETSEQIYKCIGDTSDEVSVSAAATLTKFNDPRGMTMLRSFLGDGSVRKRRLAVQAIAERRDQVDQVLLSRDMDAAVPGIDPLELISHSRVSRGARKLGLSEQDIRRRYEALATELGLLIGWQEEQRE